MKEIEYQQKMCASAGQIPPLQEQTAKAGKQRGLVPVSHGAVACCNPAFTCCF